MPEQAFRAFRAELGTLREILSRLPGRTVRDETLKERFRTLFRTWFSVVSAAISPFLHSKRDLQKLTAEIQALAALTNRIKPASDYRKRLYRAIALANGLVLYLPAAPGPLLRAHPPAADELFIPQIPDLPLRLVPNSILGWKSQIAAFVASHPFDRSVFMMIRYRKRNENLIAGVKAELGRCGYQGILARDHNLTDDLYNPIACLLCCSRGLAVFGEPETQQFFNPNVAYELGMMHLLGRECRILKHESLSVLHTDILMKLYMEYCSVSDAVDLIRNWLSPEK